MRAIFAFAFKQSRLFFNPNSGNVLNDYLGFLIFVNFLIRSPRNGRRMPSPVPQPAYRGAPPASAGKNYSMAFAAAPLNTLKSLKVTSTRRMPNSCSSLEDLLVDIFTSSVVQVASC